jgi:hypothetical protein|tara:strand:- start:1163 stop:1360 length:198 start_codon:yes stop_codon:yes gene_type:complete
MEHSMWPAIAFLWQRRLARSPHVPGNPVETSLNGHLLVLFIYGQPMRDHLEILYVTSTPSPGWCI